MPGIVTATIAKLVPPQPSQLLGGQYIVLSLDMFKAINKIPSAEIVLVDGDAAQQTFELSNTDFFNPGSKIEIALRYEGESDTTVFVGYVVQHGLQANRKKSTLTLYLKDAAIKLTQQRNNAIFRGQDDMAIMKDILQTVITQDQQRNIADLEIGDLKPSKTAMVHPEMVQFYCSDWDFILSRAAANGLWVMVDTGIISIQSPALIENPPVELEYGRDEIIDLEIEADIRAQYATVEAIAWDPQTQALSSPQKGTDYALKQDNLDPASLGKTIGADRYHLVSGAALAAPELKDWASATTLHQRLAMLRGRIQIPGRADLQIGDTLVLKKFGDRFSGTALVTAVRHQVNETGWQTDLQFGLPATSAVTDQEVMAAPANRLLPAVNGLHIGVVNATADDAGELKVQVLVPGLTVTSATPPSDKHDGLVWARLATLDAGLAADGKQGRGTLFRPEPGDEVVLGFLNDDPRQPVILGALHNAVNKPPLPVTQENLQRGIVSKEQLKVVFNDEDRSIRLETPNTNRIILVDEDGAIYIVDEHNNQFTLNADGIQLSSDQDIAITAKGDVTLKGANIDVQ